MTGSEITEIIIQTINSIFNSFIGSIDNSLYSILDKITFISSDILKEQYFEKIFGTNANSGIILISNSLLVGFVLYYLVHFIFSSYINAQIDHPLKFVFKILLISILLNNSFFICEKILNINFLISSSIKNVGESLYNKDMSFSELLNQLNKTATIESDFNYLSFNGIIKLMSSSFFINLVFTYSLRYIMVKVFILIFPLCILTLSNRNTIWIFKSWLKCFLSLLLVQQLISIIFLIIFSIDFSSNIFSQIMYIGSIYALLKANSYIKEIFGGITTDVQNNISNFNFLKRL